MHIDNWILNKKSFEAFWLNVEHFPSADNAFKNTIPTINWTNEW